MPYYGAYRGFDVHLDEAVQTAGTGVAWIVRGYGQDRATGTAPSRPEAYAAACAAVDRIMDNPYRFPINLIGYPEAFGGDVVSQDGEVLGTWRMTENEALEVVEFIPDGTDDVLFRDHLISLLCAQIEGWHQKRPPA